MLHGKPPTDKTTPATNSTATTSSNTTPVSGMPTVACTLARTHKHKLTPIPPQPHGRLLRQQPPLQPLHLRLLETILDLQRPLRPTTRQQQTLPPNRLPRFQPDLHFHRHHGAIQPRRAGSTDHRVWRLGCWNGGSGVGGVLFRYVGLGNKSCCDSGHHYRSSSC